MFVESKRAKIFAVRFASTVGVVVTATVVFVFVVDAGLVFVVCVFVCFEELEFKIGDCGICVCDCDCDCGCDDV